MNAFFASLCLCGLWELSAWALDMVFFPRFTTCLGVLDGPYAKALICHTGASLSRVGAGLLAGGIAGTGVGLFLGQSPKWDRIVSPFLFLTYPFPKVALIPILIFFFGPGEASKISLLGIFSFYQLAVTARDAAKSIAPSYLLSFQTLGGGTWARLQHVILPASMPQLLSCLRISLGTGLALIFFTETYATEQGMGYAIWDAFAQFDYPRVYLASGWLCITGWGLYTGLEWVEKRIIGWV